jgi:hypothetical protein
MQNQFSNCSKPFEQMTLNELNSQIQMREAALAKGELPHNESYNLINLRKLKAQLVALAKDRT